MRVSLNWLRELVEVPDPEALPAKLTFAGLEVEAVERRGAGLDQVIVARILSSKPHPKADRLSVVEADAGGRTLQIVCGAKNYKVGDLVPLALPGAVLPGGLQIAEAELRGVKSSGMLCSQRELALSESHEGLFLLPSGSPGQKLTEALPLADTVYEINVTPNRGDCLSHLGIAREVAALTGAARKPSAGAHATTAVKHGLAKPHLHGESTEGPRCARISLVPVQSPADLGAPSPFWMQSRLLACGVRPLGLAIDITNYVMLELGQPLHAYDLDKLKSGIAVRLARPGEKIETLDGVVRDVSADDLLICDGDLPVGLAGVMGGASTRVTAGTQRLYLEAASFAASGVRRAAKRHGLPSEASHRFERGVDPELPGKALNRAAALLLACAPGTAVGSAEVAEAVPVQRRRVPLAFKRAADLLGVALSGDEIVRKLASVEISVASGDALGASFQIPTHRSDLLETVELIAEVGRLVGYDKIPARAPRQIGAPPAVAPLERLRSALRGELFGAGFSETVQYSFFAGPIPAAFAAPGDPDPVKIINPLRQEQGEMRRSLLPSLCETAQRNLAHLTRDAGLPASLKLFEIASVYRWPSATEIAEGPAVESPHLGMLWHGPRAPLGWGTAREGREAADIHDLRGLVERLFERLGKPVRLVAADKPMLHPRSSAEVWSDEVCLGVVGELHPGLAKDLDLPKQLLLCELDLTLLGSVAVLPRRPSVPKFPAVLRDIALVLGAEVAAEEVARVLRTSGGALLEALTLFDVYQGAPLASGEKSLAYSLRFRAEDRTLTDAEVAAPLAAMVAAVGTALKARLRS